MIDVTIRNGHYIVILPKAILVLTRTEFIQALRQGNWWRRRQALNVRVALWE